jgi:titin
LKATNAAGNTFVASSAIAIPRTVPGAPIITTFIPGNRTIDISFNAPSFDGGNAITDYAYSFYPDTSYNSIGPVPIQYQITDLSNGTPYTIYLKAYNAAGNTIIASNAVAIPRTVPGAPEIKAVTLKDSAIDISFGAPLNDGGNAITEYKYSYFQDSAYISMGSTPTTYTVSPLTNGISYTIYLKAYNAAGNTITSSSVTAIPRTVPGAPIINTLVPKNGAIDISFNAPASNGGNAIIEYKYSLYPDSSYNSMGPTPTTYPVPGLTNGTPYTIYLKAYNAAGNTVIASSGVVTPRTVPGAPVINAVTVGNTIIDISFGAPISNGGNTITNYWYSFYPDSSYNLIGPSPTTYTVSRLTNGTTYTIYLKASNAAGNTVTASSVTAIPKTFPRAPIITSSTPGNSSITISFSDPSDNGGNAITGYSYSYYPDSSYNLIGPSPTTFSLSGLTNGQSYTVYLKATNSVGSTLVPSSTTLTPRTVPTAPRIDTIVPIDSTLQVSILPPSNNGGSSITGYYYTVNGGSPVFGSTAINTVLNIPNLINGTSYTIAVLAENAAGLSVASASVSSVPYTIPGSPLVDNIVYAPNTITLTVNEPSTGGSAITGYYYEIGNSGILPLGSVAGISYTIAGLTNSRNTTVYIYAQNAAGYSVPFIILSQNVSDEPENVPNIIRFRSAFSNNLAYYKPGSLTTSGGGSGVTNARAVKLRT